VGFVPRVCLEAMTIGIQLYGLAVKWSLNVCVNSSTLFNVLVLMVAANNHFEFELLVLYVCYV